jgi:hypothetical protein
MASWKTAGADGQMHENAPKASLTMVCQFPECTNGGQADLSITVPKHLHDLGNSRLHGVMEARCG